ncbi:HAMP domain-containing histidine kinase [Methylosinus sp. H3A]|nr:HAMP domain-containing histidine kinase [Methylosinus sp. H3A]
MGMARSLANRVVAYLVVSQFIAFAAGWLVTLVLGFAGFGIFEGFGRTADELASTRMIGLVLASLKQDDDGALRLQPIRELRAEARDTPRLKFAVFDAARNVAAAGSSPELIAALTGAIKVNPTHTHFILPGDPIESPQGLVEPVRTPFGRLHVAVYAMKFVSADLLYAIYEDFRHLVGFFVVTALISAGAAMFAVRRGLTPLRAVADEAARIDMNELQQRLPVGNVPAEVAPLVHGMNVALERLAASAVRIRRYADDAAHELRTPIAILRARLDNLEELPVKGALLRDASRLQAIIEQMLAAARLSGRQDTLDQEIDLVSSVREVVSLHLPLAIECDRMIEFDAAAPVIVARGNFRAVEAIVANLIDNALRAEPPGGTIIIRVGPGPVVCVIDHGEGVARAEREMIFEPFWRRSEATPGTGLGLAIAKELMEKLRGSIAIEETPGGGATFELIFSEGESARPCQ